MTAATITPPREAELWVLHWINRGPTVARYQEPVTLARVLGEHRAAVAAEPVDHLPAATNTTRN